jgi:hypothetical protein
MFFPLHYLPTFHHVLLILILHLFVGAPSYAPSQEFRPARRCSQRRRMASPPNEIPFFVIKAAMVAVRKRRRNPMTSTLIPPNDLKDLPTTELQSKFFQVASDVARMRRVCEALPMAEASLNNISNELAVRKYRTPKP